MVEELEEDNAEEETEADDLEGMEEVEEEANGGEAAVPEENPRDFIDLRDLKNKYMIKHHDFRHFRVMKV